MTECDTAQKDNHQQSDNRFCPKGKNENSFPAGLKPLKMAKKTTKFFTEVKRSYKSRKNRSFPDISSATTSASR